MKWKTRKITITCFIFGTSRILSSLRKNINGTISVQFLIVAEKRTEEMKTIVRRFKRFNLTPAAINQLNSTQMTWLWCLLSLQMFWMLSFFQAREMGLKRHLYMQHGTSWRTRQLLGIKWARISQTPYTGPQQLEI